MAITDVTRPQDPSTTAHPASVVPLRVIDGGARDDVSAAEAAMLPGAIADMTVWISALPSTSHLRLSFMRARRALAEDLEAMQAGRA